jgi:hypothetical protein
VAALSFVVGSGIDAAIGLETSLLDGINMLFEYADKRGRAGIPSRCGIGASRIMDLNKNVWACAARSSCGDKNGVTLS